MTWREAWYTARSGRRVRQVVWFDRWLEFEIAGWYLIVVNPITRVQISRRIVEMPDGDTGWFFAEWTTDDLPPASTILDRLPWIIPMRLQLRGTIDGSDFFEIGPTQIKHTHRNFQPPRFLEINLGAGWNPWPGGNFNLGSDLSEYDVFSLTVLQGRGAVSVTRPWADGSVEILIDDDSYGGDDDYHIQIDLQWSVFSL